MRIGIINHGGSRAAVGRNHIVIEQEETEGTEFWKWTDGAPNPALFVSVSSVTSCSRILRRNQSYVVDKKLYEIFVGRDEIDG